MKKIITLLILLITFGCNKPQNQFEENFRLIDSLQLHNKILDNVSFGYFHYYNKSGNYFIFINNNKIVGVDMFDKIQFEISLNRLDSMDNKEFLYYNSDSIFISSFHKKSYEMFITLINKKGEIINNWNISKYAENIKDTYFYIKTNYMHPMIFIDNKLYFQASYNFKPGTIKYSPMFGQISQQVKMFF
ncbi:MAG: hypothetical protein WCO13_14600, partial [Bacteroidota bacterium]